MCELQATETVCVGCSRYCMSTMVPSPSMTYQPCWSGKRDVSAWENHCSPARSLNIPTSGRGSGFFPTRFCHFFLTRSSAAWNCTGYTCSRRNNWNIRVFRTGSSSGDITAIFNQNPWSNCMRVISLTAKLSARKHFQSFEKFGVFAFQERYRIMDGKSGFIHRLHVRIE